MKGRAVVGFYAQNQNFGVKHQHEYTVVRKRSSSKLETLAYPARFPCMQATQARTFGLLPTGVSAFGRWRAPLDDWGIKNLKVFWANFRFWISVVDIRVHKRVFCCIVMWQPCIVAGAMYCGWGHVL